MTRIDSELNLWAFSCAHVGTDLRRGRRSLADAIEQSERGGEKGGPPFEWDIAIDAGDDSGCVGLPDETEGRNVVEQFGALQRHPREAVYNIGGNHDRNGPQEEQGSWFRTWVDPLGENTATSGVDPPRRPYRVEGSWERYSFRVGNILFLMMSDINDSSRSVGRGTLGGDPGGAVSGQTFEWWKQMVEGNQESIIVTAHHYMLKDTTVASGEWEGLEKGEDGRWIGTYHSYFERGAPKGTSYLYWLDGREDAQAFETYLGENPGAIDMWIGAHTHTNPDDRYGGKSHIESKWGANFVNVACLSRHHANYAMQNIPMSRLLTFRDGSDRVRIRCYLHTDEYKYQGWYPSAERTVQLSKAFDP